MAMLFDECVKVDEGEMKFAGKLLTVSGLAGEHISDYEDLVQIRNNKWRTAYLRRSRDLTMASSLRMPRIARKVRMIETRGKQEAIWMLKLS